MDPALYVVVGLVILALVWNIRRVRAGRMAKSNASFSSSEAPVTVGADGQSLSTQDSASATAIRILDSAQSAAAAGDIRSEQEAITRAVEYAREHGGAKALKVVEKEIAELESKRKIYIDSELIGVVRPESWLSHSSRTEKLIGRGGAPIVVRTDRLIQNGVPYLLDRHTSANVVVDGREQITQRPTLTRMLLLSPLPGSALIGGMALQKQTKNDSRQADFIVASADWSLMVPINPTDLSDPRRLAERINAIADRMKSATKRLADPTPQPGAPNSELDQLSRIDELYRSGILTLEEARDMKDRVLGKA